MNYIPISWIEDYLTYIKNVDTSVDEGSCLDWDEFIKNEIRDMVDTWEEEADEDYVLCEKKREVIEKKPNGETIVKEYYVPVDDDTLVDWKKAYIKLVEYIGRYIDGKTRWEYKGNDQWSDIYDGRLRSTAHMSDVVICTLRRGKWTGQSHD